MQIFKENTSKKMLHVVMAPLKLNPSCFNLYPANITQKKSKKINQQTAGRQIYVYVKECAYIVLHKTQEVSFNFCKDVIPAFSVFSRFTLCEPMLEVLIRGKFSSCEKRKWELKTGLTITNADASICAYLCVMPRTEYATSIDQ